MPGEWYGGQLHLAPHRKWLDDVAMSETEAVLCVAIVAVTVVLVVIVAGRLAKIR